MRAKLSDLLAQKEGFESLSTMDANSRINPHDADNVRLSQSAITAVLTGFYYYSRDERLAADILQQQHDMVVWADKLFGSNKSALMVKIASYAGITPSQAKAKVNKVIADFIKSIRELAPDNTGDTIKEILTEERNEIINHLPVVIGLSEMLNDRPLDVHTNNR